MTNRIKHSFLYCLYGLFAAITLQAQETPLTKLYVNCENTVLLGNILSADEISRIAYVNSNLSARSILNTVDGILLIYPKTPSNDFFISFTDKNHEEIKACHFSVAPLPSPKISVGLSLGLAANQIDLQAAKAQGISASIEVSARYPEMAAVIAKDIRYRVSEWWIHLFHGQRAVQSIKVYTKAESRLNELMELASPGDRIMISVKEIQRMNYQNRVETIPIKNHHFNINIQ